MFAMFKFETSIANINGKNGLLKRVSNNVIENLDQNFNKGIDIICEFSNPPPTFVIIEVKYNKATMSKEITKSGGSQMSVLWVEHNLLNGIVNPELRRRILTNGYDPYLSNVTTDNVLKINAINQTLTSATKGNQLSNFIN